MTDTLTIGTENSLSLLLMFAAGCREGALALIVQIIYQCYKIENP